MNKYLSITVSDFKNLRRDPTLLVLFFVPVLILGVIRFGIPYISEYIPTIDDFHKEIISFFALLNAVFPGFIISFMLLDEKDLQLFPVINVTPVSLSGFLAVRIVFMVFFGFLSSMLLIMHNGIYSISIFKAIQLAMLCALNTPILILLIISIAKNKVEGLSMLKLATVSLMIPMLVFFFNTFWVKLLAIFPAFWVYAFMDSVKNQQMIFILGMCFLGVLNYFCFRYAVKMK
ncbi:MAG: hypothetical protein GQ564_14390 [Bacteroidales bacterium]|nr:hypothetical protein [Bacteroidales bacterium]